MLRDFSRFEAQRCSQIFLPAQNRARRCHRDSKMSCDHFGLSSLPRTRCTEQNKTFFHSAAVKEDRHPANDKDRNCDIKPHQRALRDRFAATVGTAGIE